MFLRERIQKLNDDAKSINESLKGLNVRAAGLNGVAATIPDSAPPPVSYFKGDKVILHNVSYDHNKKSISAAIAIPYREEQCDISKHSGAIFRVSINEDWFK